jgi:hypothetical protein
VPDVLGRDLLGLHASGGPCGRHARRHPINDVPHVPGRAHPVLRRGACGADRAARLMAQDHDQGHSSTSTPYSMLRDLPGEAAGAPVFHQQPTDLIDALTPWAHEETMPDLLSLRQGTTPDELRAVYGHDRYDRLAAIKKR